MSLSADLGISFGLGGLAGIAVESGTVTLAGQLQAGMTIGIDLTPLCRDFERSPRLPLSRIPSLQRLLELDGSVVMDGLPDLEITRADGSLLTVDFGGARTVGDLVARFRSEIGSTIQTEDDRLDIAETAVLSGGPGDDDLNGGARSGQPQ